jgi:hypothetical protein
MDTSTTQLLNELLESQLKAQLDEKFPLADTDDLIRLCIEVERFIIAIFYNYFDIEMKMYEKTGYEWKSHGRFNYRGTSYVVRIEESNILRDGAVQCAIRLADQNPLEQIYAEPLTIDMAGSWTKSFILVKCEPSVAHLGHILTTLIERIILNTSQWLLTRIEQVNAEAKSHALEKIINLLALEFGDRAQEMMLATVINDGAGEKAIYAVGATQFCSIAETIKHGGAATVSKGQILSGLVQGAMNYAETEASRVFASRRGAFDVGPTTDKRKYAGKNLEILLAESAMFKKSSVIDQPLVYDWEVANKAKLLLVYPSKLVRDGDTTIPDRVDKLRQRIKTIMSEHDLMTPLLQMRKRSLSQQAKSAAILVNPGSFAPTPDLESLRKKVQHELARLFRRTNTEAQDEHIIRVRLKHILRAAHICQNISVLYQAYLLVTANNTSDYEKARQLVGLFNLHE